MNTIEPGPSRGLRREVRAPRVGNARASGREGASRRERAPADRHSTDADRCWTTATTMAAIIRGQVLSDLRCPTAIVRTIAVEIDSILAAAFCMGRAGRV